MSRILLVKTSSLGDVVHNLPVASDIGAAFPGAALDWVVEERFIEIPRLHGAVKEVIPVALRRWRTALWRPEVWREIASFMRRVRSKRYDAVIDTQGLLKSALITRAAHGKRYGLDWKSSREPLTLFYDRTFAVARGRHAVERNRALAALALGYAPKADIDYGIHASSMRFGWLPGGPYAVLLHATSAARKHWPEPRWLDLARALADSGMQYVLPWGNRDERERSERLAGGIERAIVPPALRLDEAASLLAGAQAVIGVDTGLTHLAGALGAPTVGIYCATDPAKTGLYGCERAVNVGSGDAAPRVAAVLDAVGVVRGAVEK